MYLKTHFSLQTGETSSLFTGLTPLQHQLLEFFIEQREWKLESLLSKMGLGYQELLQELTFLEMMKRIEEVGP